LGDRYVHGGNFLDVFAYTQFNNLDKKEAVRHTFGRISRRAMRKNLIPFVHIQRGIVKENAIEQTDGKSLAEYIVEREAMESSDGKSARAS